MIENINIYLGIVVLMLNTIPFVTNKKYYAITLPVSILLVLIKIFFIK